jgi:hypothetical protein
VAALRVLAESPSIQLVRVATVEAYGEQAAPPPGADVQFQGVDAQAGPLVRYTVIHETRADAA